MLTQNNKKEEYIEEIERRTADVKKKAEEAKQHAEEMLEETKHKVEEKKVSVLSKLSTKIAYMVTGLVLIPMICSILMVSRQTSETMDKVYKNYAQNLAEEAVIGIDLVSSFGLELTNERLSKIMSDIEIKDVDGSYAYLVSPTGTMLWHSEDSKIGKSVENAAVKGIVEQLSKGKSVSNGAVVYDYHGEQKLAGYAFTSGGLIVVVTGDYDLMYKDITSLKYRLMNFSVIMIVVSLVAGGFLTMLIMRSFKQLLPIIQSTARLDFVDNGASEELVKRHDEIGVIARALASMRENLKGMVASIDNASDNICENINGIFDKTTDINAMCTDNSATSEELAASMEETTASSTAIAGNVEQMHEGAVNIEKLALNGISLSGEVMDRAEELKNTTDVSTKKTIAIYENVKTRSQEAIEASKAVAKINELSETIMSISSQTQLLSLNASIEAARAGEAGRGFAVVANEIGSLASQTSTAVEDITDIVDEVRSAVDRMADCIKEITNFLDSNVLEDYREFGRVSDQYKVDADSFKETMSVIGEGIKDLNESIKTIVKSVEGINSTMSEATSGVTDIAAKTGNMVEATTDATVRVEECRDYVDELEAIIKQFKI